MRRIRRDDRLRRAAQRERVDPGADEEAEHLEHIPEAHLLPPLTDQHVEAEPRREQLGLLEDFGRFIETSDAEGLGPGRPMKRVAISELAIGRIWILEMRRVERVEVHVHVSYVRHTICQLPH